jgi:tetratricopeptide (TPR) repeat protein
VINKQASILFIPTSITGYEAERRNARSLRYYYQELLFSSLAHSASTTEGFQRLGHQLAAVARRAWAAKDLETVEQASQRMLSLPIADQLESVAQYYQALCSWRRGDTENARQSLERVVDGAPPAYRARALQIIGLTYHNSGEIDAALPFYIMAGSDAAKVDLATLVESQRMTAVIRSIHGDHKQALADLESLFSPIRAISRYFPVLYYELLNSLAVELSEVGRLAEAEAALSIALASSFASAYPEWTETRDEILAKRTSATPSVVAIDRTLKGAELPQPALQRRANRVLWFALTPPVEKRNLLQRASRSNATVAVFRDSLTQGILDRLLVSTGPRAPPISS